jgi:hypothetical protein
MHGRLQATASRSRAPGQPAVWCSKRAASGSSTTSARCSLVAAACKHSTLAHRAAQPHSRGTLRLSQTNSMHTRGARQELSPAPRCGTQQLPLNSCRAHAACNSCRPRESARPHRSTHLGSKRTQACSPTRERHAPPSVLPPGRAWCWDAAAAALRLLLHDGAAEVLWCARDEMHRGGGGGMLWLMQRAPPRCPPPGCVPSALSWAAPTQTPVYRPSGRQGPALAALRSCWGSCRRRWCPCGGWLCVCVCACLCVCVWLCVCVCVCVCARRACVSAECRHVLAHERARHHGGGRERGGRWQPAPCSAARGPKQPRGVAVHAAVHAAVLRARARPPHQSGAWGSSTSRSMRDSSCGITWQHTAPVCVGGGARGMATHMCVRVC